ncbi:Homoserine/homoserine lactone efflux protein [Hydrogenovibrio crunogenus]|uniref:Homoserine/homoserine lactone efflux protein n=1 Tax=Hydrogenovibrio crunogenus TaxID=39765 RepID=A0A4P7NWC2_9GAMM|nr:LysE family translocator [Hydrogenovibrio crunogenus]QBZ82000.1 Homoserine/homoserine lactone efflux protein [Hydrogenovibrio crunogenus]
MPFDTFVSFTLVMFLLALSPGPDNLYVLMQSALYTRIAGIWVTLGLCTGLIVHTLAAALGITMIFQTSEIAFTLLKILGAGYLFFLAWKSYQSGAFHLKNNSVSTLSAIQLYQRGIWMNLTNPKVSIFFLALLPQFIDTSARSVSQQMLMLGSITIMVTLMVFSSIAMLAGFAKNWIQSEKIQRSLHKIAALILLTIALKLLISLPYDLLETY